MPLTAPASIPVTLPVHLRVGDSPPCHVGDLTLDVAGGPVPRLEVAELRRRIAAFLREAADAFESAEE